MSLQVWLPLNGNLENRGLSNVAVTNYGATISDGGKIGKCYSFDGSSCLDTDYTFAPGTGDFTISVWAYISSSVTSYTFEPLISSKDAATVTAGIAIYYNPDVGKLSWSTADGSSAQEIYTADNVRSLLVDGWHHIAMCRKSSDSKHGWFYVDGVRYELASVPSILNITNPSGAFILGSLIGRYYNYTGRLNDFRVYDHCLSAAEVKEISKGLILHYPMNDPYTSVRNWRQLVNNGNFANDVDGWNWSGMLPGYTISNNTLTYSGVNYYQSFIKYMYDFIPDHIYCFRCQYKHNYSDSVIWEGKHEYGSGIYYKVLPSSDKFVNFSNYFTALSASAGTMFQVFGSSQTDSATISFKNCMLFDLTDMYGAGNEPSEENFLSTFNSDYYNYSSTPLVGSSTMYDCSGYENHGNVNGSFKLKNDTRRYRFSSIGSNSAYIDGRTTSVQEAVNNGNPFTISFWCKRPTSASQTSSSKGIFEIGDSGTFQQSLHGIFRANGSFCFSFYDPDTYSTFNVEDHLDEWHHITCVYSSPIMYIYIDGIQDTMFVTDKTLQLQTTRPHCKVNYAQNYCNDENQISDFRIYSTALSASDIEELYNVGAKVLKNGALMCYEIKEN